MASLVPATTLQPLSVGLEGACWMCMSMGSVSVAIQVSMSSLLPFVLVRILYLFLLFILNDFDLQFLFCIRRFNI